MRKSLVFLVSLALLMLPASAIPQCIVPANGAVVKTASYAALAADTGKLIVMNCSTACTLTLPATPQSPVWTIGVETIGTGQVTIARNGLTINSVAADVVLPTTVGFTENIWTDNANYFATREIPVTAGAITAAGTTWVGYTIFTPSVTANVNAVAVLVANQPELFLFNLPVTAKATKATVYVQTGVSASTGDVGVYNFSGTLVAHTGSFSTATTGGAVSTTISGGAVTLDPGQYYLAVCDSSATVTLADVLGNGTNVNALMGGAGVPAHTWGTDATDTCTVGVLPASITTTNVTNSTSSSLAVPLILFSN